MLKTPETELVAELEKLRPDKVRSKLGYGEYGDIGSDLHLFVERWLKSASESVSHKREEEALFPAREANSVAREANTEARAARSEAREANSIARSANRIARQERTATIIAAIAAVIAAIAAIWPMIIGASKP